MLIKLTNFNKQAGLIWGAKKKDKTLQICYSFFYISSLIPAARVHVPKGLQISRVTDLRLKREENVSTR